MKKKCFFILFALCNLLSYSQTSGNEHLTVMGISLGCDIEEAVKNLQMKGFTLVKNRGTQYDDRTMYYDPNGAKGNFWKFKKAMIIIKSFPKTNTLSIFHIATPEYSYLAEFVSLLDDKYGPHTTTMELIECEGENGKEKGNASHLHWKLKEGKIELVHHGKIGYLYYPRIEIFYYDYPEYQLMEKEKNESDF